MISLEALASAGLTNKRLKEILTSQAPRQPDVKRAKGRTRDSVPIQPPDKGGNAGSGTSVINTIFTLEELPEKPTDWDVRCFLETTIRGQSIEGMMRCAANFDMWGAMDLAYASIPIHKAVLPLMQVAMGYISLESCAGQIGALSEEWKNTLFERDAQGKVTGVNPPKLVQVTHNLVHSLVSRRVAALATEVYQQYPLLKFEPFSNTQTGRFVADVMTQLTEQMAGGYGYRKDYEESIRQASLYTTSIKFKASAWHCDKQTLPVPTRASQAKGVGRAEKPQMKRQIVKEGVLFTIPHPSRTSYDISQPLSKLNNDLGPRWVEHWEVVPIGVVRANKDFFNKDSIAMDASWFQYLQANQAYFSQYYADRICAPRLQAPAVGSAASTSLSNDRVANIGTWAQLHDETSTVLTEHFMRVIPKDVGLGKYEDPVWIRFVMAAQTTIVFAEICGSCPASVNSYNATDGLLVSPSFGMQAIQHQQKITNLMNELLHVQYQGMARMWALNIHGMTKKEVEAFTKAIKYPNFANPTDILITYDAELLAQRGQDIRTVTQKIEQIRIETKEKVSEIYGSIVQELAIAERLLFFSPQELGQVSPRTITAFEAKMVANTTLGIRDYHLIGVKQQMDADKRIIHSSYQAFGSDDLEVPVAERYEPSVIEAAGFEIVDDGSGRPPDGLYTIRGKKLGLFYNYTFTTRNTDDTPPEAAEAQGLAEIYKVIASDETLKNLMTNAQIVELFNSFATRISPTFQRLNLPPGVDPNGRAGAKIDMVVEAIQQLATQQKQQAAQIQATDAGIKGLADALANLTAALGVKMPRANGSVSTKKGQISPETPVGSGAPPLRGASQPRPVPAL